MANVRYTNLPVENLKDNNDNVSQESKTRTFFNGYFDQPVQITGVEWDLVYSFFLKHTGNEEAANAMSEAIITAARSQDLNVLDLIKDLQKFEGIELDQVLALYLNQTRRNTSLLGYSQALTPNKYASRNILA